MTRIAVFARNFESGVLTPPSFAVISHNDEMLGACHDGGVKVAGPMGLPSQTQASWLEALHSIVSGASAPSTRLSDDDSGCSPSATKPAHSIICCLLPHSFSFYGFMCVLI